MLTVSREDQSVPAIKSFMVYGDVSFLHVIVIQFISLASGVEGGGKYTLLRNDHIKHLYQLLSKMNIQ